MGIDYGALPALGPDKGQGGAKENAEGSLWDTHFVWTTLARAYPCPGTRLTLHQNKCPALLRFRVFQ